MNEREWFNIFDLVKLSMIGRGRYKINKVIRYYIFLLREEFGYTYDDINNFAHITAFDFVEKLYDKYDDSKGSLSVFINGFVLNNVRNRYRDLIRHQEMFESYDDEINYDLYPTEEKIIQKDLWFKAKIMDDTEGELYWAVLSGELKQVEAAKKLNISKQAFNKRYQIYKKKLADVL